MTTDLVDADQARRRVLVVDDHRLLGEALQDALGGAGFDAYHSGCGSTEEIIEDARRHRPQVVVLDFRLAASGQGGDLIRPLVDLGASVLVVSETTDRMALARCLEAGAAGMASKEEPLAALLDKIHRAANGEAVTAVRDRVELSAELRSHRRAEQARQAPFESLTPRERHVLGMIADGRPAADIAQASYVSLPTVRSQIRSILQKLEVNSQIAAVAMARNSGWCGPSVQRSPQIASRGSGR